ncbi:hypothetical protein ACFLY3_03980 [Chloroflexota bacterium]
MKVLVCSVLTILILSFLLPLSAVYAIPPTANEFYGYVTLDGEPAPNGTSVTAEMNGRTAGSTTVSGGIYEITINTIEGDAIGDSISFYVDGYSAGSASLNAGQPTQKNLSATSPLPDYTLSINTSGDGSASGAGTYTAGDVVNISAEPDYGWGFDNWTGDTSTIANTNDPTTTITMDDNYAITANFEELPTYELTINIDGEGTVIGDGIYPEGYETDIRASPDEGWVFDNWTGNTSTIVDVNDPTTTITMNSNYTITANFSEAEMFTLTIAVNGSGSTIPRAGEHEYQEGEVVKITATPDEGWQFVNWSGDVADPNSASTSVTIDTNKTVTVNFSQTGVTNYSLTIAVNGNGSTSPAAGNYIYAEGMVVNITATPDEGWQFDGWTGDVADPNSSGTTVTMDSDKTVTANFSEKPTVEYTLTMAMSGSGAITPAVGTYTYTEGTVVNINAIPASGWQFDNWSGGVAQPNSASTTVIIDSDKTVTANFSYIIDEYTLTMVVNGNGTTSPMVGNHTYVEGTVVNITATPDDNWQFDGWSGDVVDPNSAGTTVTMDSDKTVTANFSQMEDTTPPSITDISASNTSKTGADIIWTTDEPGDSQVEFWASPGQLTPLDGTLVTEHLVHLADLTPATTYHYNVMSKDWAGNLTTSDEYTFTTLGLPATFITGDWDISLTDIDTGEQAAISFSVANVGDLAGSYQISLEINGEVEATKEGTLGAGASEALTFTITREDAGTYRLIIDGLILSFTLEEVSPPSFPIWLLIIGIIIGLAILAIPIILLVRKRRMKDRLMPGSLFLGETEPDAEIKPEPAVEEKAPGEAEGYTRREAIEIKESGRSFKVTAPAAEKLKEALLSKTTDPEVGFRLIPSPLKSNQLKMTLDTAKEGDQVMEKDGVKILILSPEVVAALEGMAMDYQETAEGGGFSISELASDT